MLNLKPCFFALSTETFGVCNLKDAGLLILALIIRVRHAVLM